MLIGEEPQRTRMDSKLGIGGNIIYYIPLCLPFIREIIMSDGGWGMGDGELNIDYLLFTIENLQAPVERSRAMG